MPAEIYVVSGFLGAGKTTLIQKIIQETFKNERIALIENDFGEISVDAALLKSCAIGIKEINSGCICCSLSGNFIKSLKALLDRFHPHKIIIEPSGVGKLSVNVSQAAESGHKQNHVHSHGAHSINRPAGRCSHNHWAEEAFDTVTIRTKRVFSKEELMECVLNMEKTARGTVLRAKGIVRGLGGCLNLQYLYTIFDRM